MLSAYKVANQSTVSIMCYHGCSRMMTDCATGVPDDLMERLDKMREDIDELRKMKERVSNFCYVVLAGCQ